MTKPLVTVVAGTGTQGRSIVNNLQKSNAYTVRTTTRNPNSAAAKELSAQGIEVVQADASDIDSLKRAFVGSTAIYAYTDFFAQFATGGPTIATEVEIQQGINLAKAAEATEGLKHYIWSTLPDGKRISGGKFVVPHFEAKNVVDRYIKANAALLQKTTFLWISYFTTNLTWAMVAPNKLASAGQYVQIGDTPATVPITSIGDASANVGKFVLAILEQPEKTLGGKFVLASAQVTTVGDMLQTWARLSGNKAQYVQVDSKTYEKLWPMWATEYGEMMRLWEWAGEKGWSGEEGILTKEDLGVTGLVSMEEALSELKL